jgi:hypothetical protein
MCLWWSWDITVIPFTDNIPRLMDSQQWPSVFAKNSIALFEGYLIMADGRNRVLEDPNCKYSFNINPAVGTGRSRCPTPGPRELLNHSSSSSWDSMRPSGFFNSKSSAIKNRLLGCEARGAASLRVDATSYSLSARRPWIWPMHMVLVDHMVKFDGTKYKPNVEPVNV